MQNSFPESNNEMEIWRMKLNAAQAFFAMVCILTTLSAHADHALLEDGRVLYNVMIPDNATTGGAQLVRIRTGSLSFAYDPRNNVVSTLPPHSVIHRLSDYIKTTRTVGREEATALVKQRQWDQYRPTRERARLVAPSPAPKFTPIPVEVAKARAKPLNVVSDTVPLDQRLTQQLDVFMKEQNTMVQDATTSIVKGILSPVEVSEQKVNLLNQQKMILEQYFPQDEETVKVAVEYWGEQVERARQTGRFDLENL